MSDWFSSFIEDENTSREQTRTAVLLAKVRYDEQLAPFVGKDETRLGFVRQEIDRIADEVSAEVGARREDVFQKLMKVIEADVLLPVSKPKTVEVDGEGGFDTKDPEPAATTSVLDHDAVLVDEIIHPQDSKLIPVQEGALKHGAEVGAQGTCPHCGGTLYQKNNGVMCSKCGRLWENTNLENVTACVRCESKTASEGSPVCEDCNTELVALAADDVPPLDGEESAPQADYVTGDRVVLTEGEHQGLAGTVTEVREADDGPCYVVELDEAVDGMLELPCMYGGAFARAEGQKEDIVVSKLAQNPAGAQPLNPNAPYQCTVCGFTGTFQAVNDHIVSAQDTEHMRAKQNPAGQQAPPTSPTQQQTGMQPYGKTAVDLKKLWDETEPAPFNPRPEDFCVNCGKYSLVAGEDPERLCADCRAWKEGDSYYTWKGPFPGKTAQEDSHDEPTEVEDPQEQVSPKGKFSDIVEAMANHAAAREFSTIQDEEIQAIAGQYGLDPNEVRKQVIVRAQFGDFVAVNGKVGSSDIPEGYTPVSVDGIGGVVDAHEAIVPTNSAVRKVAEDLGMEEGNVYSSIKDAMGADLSDEYHTSVSGEHMFYLPQELLDSGEPAQPEPPAPEVPQMAPTQQMQLAKDLRISLLRTARRLEKLEAEVDQEGKAV